jgi:uncharacterized surface protein with fasciclin (FAS1) repeats
MPKVKIFIASDSSTDHDDYYSRVVLRQGITDWEEISDDDLVFLRENLDYIVDPKKYGYSAIPLIISQDEYNIKKRIKLAQKNGDEGDSSRNLTDFSCARNVELLAWYRGHLPDYEPSRGALECAALLADIPLLTKVLTYHVLPGRVLRAQVPVGPAITTLQGETFTVDSTLAITDRRGRRAGITATDVFTSNGVIHVLDRVILPAP